MRLFLSGQRADLFEGKNKKFPISNFQFPKNYLLGNLLIIVSWLLIICLPFFQINNLVSLS